MPNPESNNGAGDDTPGTDVTGDDTPENKGDDKTPEGGSDDDKDKGEKKTVSIDEKEFLSMKKTLTESQKLIKKFEKEKKDATDADLLEKGKFEELLTKTKVDLEEKTTAFDKLQESNNLAVEKLDILADQKIKKFTETHGDDKLAEIKSIVWEDKLKIAESIPQFEKLIGKSWKLPADKWTPAWNGGSDRRSVLRKKVEEGTANRREKQEFRSLISTKD